VKHTISLTSRQKLTKKKFHSTPGIGGSEVHCSIKSVVKGGEWGWDAGLTLICVFSANTFVRVQLHGCVKEAALIRGNFPFLRLFKERSLRNREFCPETMGTLTGTLSFFIIFTVTSVFF
jgi:hypothetical protein